MSERTAAADPAPAQLLRADRLLAIAVILGLALRLAAAALGPIVPVSDAGWYVGRAIEIAAGHGYVDRGVATAFWPVGWPGALGALFFVAGPSILAIKLANAVMSWCVLLLTAALATRLSASRVVGAWAALLMAVYPNAIGYVPFALTEIFYQVLLLAAIWLLSCRGRWTAFAAGLVFGVATLTKTQTLVVPLFLLAAPMLRREWRGRWRRFAGAAGIVYLGLFLVVLPWTWRNAVELHAFVPVSTNGGWTFLTGNNPQARGGYTPQTVLAEGINHDPADQVAMDHLARQRALAWIAANKLRFVELMPLKAWHLWAFDGEAEWSYQAGFPPYPRYQLAFRAARVVNQAFYVVLLLLAVPAAWRLLRGPVPPSPWAMSGIAMVVFTTLLCLVFSGEARLHFDLMPLIAIMSASTLVRRTNPSRGETGGADPALRTQQ